MRTLLIDNYDSFTFNLYQLLAEVNEEPPLVVRHDAADWEVVRRLPFDNIVISPGPGRPERDGDFGVCRAALEEASVPILGVCLGHQGLCHVLGGAVDYAAVVMHGRSSEVHHRGTGLFNGVPSPFEAIRYHSLVVTDMPETLSATAWTHDGVLMGVEHRELPLFGVQFHPESIGTEYGSKLIENFKAITEQHWASRPRPLEIGDGTVAPGSCCEPFTGGQVPATLGPQEACEETPLRVYSKRLAVAPDPVRAFETIYRDSRHSFWIDSALKGPAGRFSFMGDASGPLDRIVSYDESEGAVCVSQGTGQDPQRLSTHPGTVFDYLDRSLRERKVMGHDLPIPFIGGFVGYLGYELETVGATRQRHRSPSPDASFLLVHRFIAFDLEAGEAYVVCLDSPNEEERASQWVDAVASRLAGVPETPEERPPTQAEPVQGRQRHTESEYLERILRCKEAIRAGESYELCLTNRIEFDVAIDPWITYLALRATNPAPYAAWLSLPGLQVLSASPERFLRIDPDGNVEAKPIKGTRPRGDTPEEDRAIAENLALAEKDRAENLIIVDLLRNDIGRTAAIGSVHVPKLFDVETYATVHQLVSTVRGRLREGCSAVQAVRAAFPGGSMTGAPKRRTLEILDQLEEGPRGVYSGALGYFSFDGATDLSIVIRTIVVEGSVVSIGVGGAIVDLSDPAEEVAEMLLKAKASIGALERTVRPRRD